MNITEYSQKTDNDKIYYGKLTIIRNYIIASADEYGYKYLDTNSCYPFSELVHKDDLATFFKAVHRLKEGSQSVIAKVKCYNGTYRCLCLVLEYNGKIIEGFESFDITFSDVMTIHENYERYIHAVKKYRKFMSMIPQLYFEYKLSVDDFVVYSYHNEKSVAVYHGKLDSFREQVVLSEVLNTEAKCLFEKFYSNMKNGIEYFEENMPAEIFSENKEGIFFEIKSSIVYKEDVKDMVVGVMNPSEKTDNEKYYLSEAAKDVGTGLLNKKAISEYTMEKMGNVENGFYLLLMDVDDFKNINDTYGHMFGDEVLVRVSEIIRSVLSSRGTVGRFGGDEFLMVLENVYDENDLRRILKTISKHVQWAFAGCNHGINITNSSGIAKFPEDGRTYEELFNKADKSLYIAKAKGKNRFIIYDEEKHGKIEQSDSNRLIGVNSVVNNEKRASAVTEIILDLHSNGVEAIMPSIKRLQRYFDVDGIAIYAGKDLMRLYEIGKYIGEIENFKFFDCPDYRQFFNDNGIYAETNIRKIEKGCPEAYDAYLKQETAEFIQCVTFAGTKAEVVVSFDVFNRKRKWSDFEVDFLTVIGKLICDVIIKSK